MVDNYLAIILVVLLITLLLIRRKKHNKKPPPCECIKSCTEEGCHFESPSGIFGTQLECEDTCKAAF